MSLTVIAYFEWISGFCGHGVWAIQVFRFTNQVSGVTIMVDDLAYEFLKEHAVQELFGIMRRLVGGR